jgi:hypothetical protein
MLRIHLKQSTCLWFAGGAGGRGQQQRAGGLPVNTQYLLLTTRGVVQDIAHWLRSASASLSVTQQRPAGCSAQGAGSSHVWQVHLTWSWPWCVWCLVLVGHLAPQQVQSTGALLRLPSWQHSSSILQGNLPDSNPAAFACLVCLPGDCRLREAQRAPTAGCSTTTPSGLQSRALCTTTSKLLKSSRPSCVARLTWWS